MNRRASWFLKSEIPWRFFKKLALLQIILTVLIVTTTAYMARYYLKSSMQGQAAEHIQESLNLLESSIFTKDQGPLSWCKDLRINTEPRFSLIDLEGEVLCDNFAYQTKLESHARRPEVIEALRNGVGKAHRFSTTTQKEMIYEARLLNHPSLTQPLILRQSTSLTGLNRAMDLLDQSILIFILPLLLLTSLASLYGSLQVSSPLRSLLKKVDYMKRAQSSGADQTVEQTTDEWQILEKTLDNAQHDLESYLNELYLENEKINTLMESISDSILAIDGNENILFANGQFRKNFAPFEFRNTNLKDYKIWEIIRDKEVQDLFKNVLETQDVLKTRNHYFEIKGGKAKAYFDLKLSPLKNHKQKIIGAVCVFHNVTDRKTAEQLREDFVTNVSHEIRTPLTALKGYVQVLEQIISKEMVPGQQIKESLKKIESNADRLTLLFNDILTLSVIESKKKVQREWIATQELTSTTISNVRQSYREKKMTITTQVEVEYVHAHPQLLEQVLTNLIDNAYKYTPGSGEISIHWKQTDKVYVLEVQDSGEKIPKKHHHRLFERFYRVDPSRSREQGGTGLGLAIVKHIVQKHYGEIRVTYGELGGNKFIVELPLGPS